MDCVPGVWKKKSTDLKHMDTDDDDDDNDGGGNDGGFFGIS